MPRESLALRSTLAPRRQFLAAGGLAVGAAALAVLGAEGVGSADAFDASSPGDALPRPHRKPRAKRIIHLHMIGAPSQLDLFDYKPQLACYDGEPCPKEFLQGRRFAFLGGELRLAASTYAFQQHGQSGQWMSELLPHLARQADRIAVVRTLQTSEINHAPAQMFLHTGFGRGGRPSLGAWTLYGLGSENRDVPGYVVLQSGPPGGAGANIWSSGFLPSVYQGIPFRHAGDPVLFLSHPAHPDRTDPGRKLAAIRQLNERRLAEVHDPEIATRIRQYEMAFRMQTSIPELTDLTAETRETLELYGARPGKPSFANNCLLARRLVERGVRFVQLFDSDWDHHADLATRLPAKCRDVDRAMAALIEDLQRRGLLDDTLLVWGAEFGRTPLRQGVSGDGKQTKPGRDHHQDAYTVWLAGGGIRGGLSYGQTDELGFSPIERPVHVHDLNATVLHLLGLDHEQLTYRYQGREFRLTDVHGQVIEELLV